MAPAPWDCAACPPPPAHGAALTAGGDAAHLALSFQLLNGKRHDPVMQSTDPVYPNVTGLSLFAILER